jgi:uncharacterized protein
MQKTTKFQGYVFTLALFYYFIFYITTMNKLTINQKALIIVGLITLLTIGFSLLVKSQVPDPQKGTYINDLAGVVSAQDKQVINGALRLVEDSFGVQMAIVLVNELPENMSIEDYAREVGRKWHVGINKKGLVYVAAILQHKQRLEVSNHLEGAVPDITANHLLDELKPYFRAQKYGEGISQMVVHLGHILNDNKAELQQSTTDKSKKGTSGWLYFGLWIGLTVPIYFLILYRIKRKRAEEAAREKERLARRENAIDKLIAEKFKRKVGNYSSANNDLTRVTRTNTYIEDPVVIPPTPDEPDEIKPGYYSSGSSGYSSGSSDSNNNSGSSDSTSSSDYGNWGSGGSSDSGSIDTGSSSGFDGGGASSDW